MAHRRIKYPQNDDIESLKERIERIEKKLSMSNLDGCPICQSELIECAIFGESKQRKMCPKCGDFHFFEYETR